MQQAHKHPNYLLVFIALGVITLVEVFIPRLLPHPVAVPLLLVLMTAKAVLVALNYMHLLTDSRYYAYIILIPLPFVLLIMGVLAIAGTFATP